MKITKEKFLELLYNPVLRKSYLNGDLVTNLCCIDFKGVLVTNLQHKDLSYWMQVDNRTRFFPITSLERSSIGYYLRGNLILIVGFRCPRLIKLDL